MNKYVLITGAYGGLGRALAHTFADKGMKLVLLGRDKYKLKALSDELSELTDVITLTADIGDNKQVEAAANSLHDKGIKIEILINNAGITYIHKFDKDYNTDNFDRLIQTNLNGSVYVTYHFIQDIISTNGSIINISSVLGYAPVIGRTAYAASKFGMEGFFSVLSAEYESLHVMMVYPTFIKTEIRQEVQGDKTVNEVLSPEEVARRIWQGYSRKKNKIYIGKTAKLSYYIYKYLPSLYIKLMRNKVAPDFQ